MKQYPLPVQISILAVLVSGLFLATRSTAPQPLAGGAASTTPYTAASAASHAATSSDETAEHAAEAPRERKQTTPTATSTRATAPEPALAHASSTTPENQVRRIENPYSVPPMKFEVVNDIARAAVVNIFCASAGNGSLRPISGSGVMIDPEGVILTNAHVAQYVLLAQSGRVHLECSVRTGSPAAPKWIPYVLYIPPAWVAEHAKDLRVERPLGTGKHDFALLYVGAPLDGTKRPASFPAIEYDAREAVAFTDDPVLASSYPAEFLGGFTTSFNLYPASSITTIQHLYTLTEGSTVDVLSIGGVIGAQSGSSGGAIVNAWAKLVALITTTSEGSTTAERDLRGVTISYIDRDLKALTGSDLSQTLSKDLRQMVRDFAAQEAPALVEKLIEQI